MPNCSYVSPDGKGICLRKSGHRQPHKFTPVTGYDETCNIWCIADGHGGVHFAKISKGHRDRLCREGMYPKTQIAMAETEMQIIGQEYDR